MPLPPKTIQFSGPLRQVQLRIPGAPRSAALAALERERAEYERGRQDGEKALSEQLVRQRSDLLAVQDGVLASLRQSVPKVVRDCEASLASLVLEVAQKVVAGLPISAEMVEAAVREALAQVEETAEFQVHLHPADLELLQRVNSALLPGNGALEKMTVHSSLEVGRGGCLVQTRFGIIDARRETKLAVLKQSLAT